MTTPQAEAPHRRLRGSVEPVASLDTGRRERMFELLSAAYANTDVERFNRDLDEKESALLLRDRETGELVGFTTMMRVRVHADGCDVVGIFSGDTVIDRAYWGDGELSRTWLRHVFELRDQEPGVELFWFMIVSGHSTYRFMPLHFKAFYPNYKQPTPPDIQCRMDALAMAKFPDEYDPETGIVYPREPSPVLPGVADITEHRQKNPHTAFMVARNPGHARGDELACLAEISEANLTKIGRRALAAGMKTADDSAAPPVPGANPA